MKIAYLLSHVPGPRFYKKMIKTKENFDIYVIYRNRNSETFQTFFFDSEIKKLEILDATLKPWKIPVNLYYKYSKNALKSLKQIDPEIIHCANLDMLLIALSYKNFWNKELKIVYEVGDLNKRTFNKSKKINKTVIRNILKFMERKSLEQIDKLVISSQYFWDEYYNQFVTKEKTFLFPNAPEKETFKNVTDNDNEMKTIGFVGRVRYFGQLKLLINVVEEINRKFNKQVYNVLIAGVGPESDKIENYSKDKGFVKILGAYNYDEEIASIYSQIDFVYSVYDEKMPNVKVAIPNRLDESIVSRKPIIVAKNTNLADFVIENNVGFAVDSEKPEDLFHLLEGIKLDKIDFKKIKDSCLNLSGERYVDAYQTEMLKVYESLLKDSKENE